MAGSIAGVLAKQMPVEKTPQDRAVLWFIVKDILVNDSVAGIPKIQNLVRDKFSGYNLKNWLIAEARYVYRRKVDAGEVPSPAGYVSLDTVKEYFGRMSKDDRIKFVDWATEEIK